MKEKESNEMKNRNNCMKHIMSAFNSNVQKVDNVWEMKKA